MLYISPLKALAVDIERNLRAPIAGIANRAVARGDAHHQPAVAIRTGDTPAAERARFLRDPADILITTPESLYLLLTSNARESLRSIDTVIVDEIHALVPTKRGAHLSLSLERLEVSGSQRDRRTLADPADRSLSDATAARRSRAVSWRPERRSGRSQQPAWPKPPRDCRIDGARRSDSRRVRVETASRSTNTARSPSSTRREKKDLELRIEVPVEDMATIGGRPD